GKQEAQLERHAEHPLPEWYPGQDFIHQQGGAVDHAPYTAAGTEPSAFTGEGHQLLVVASLAAYPQKAVFQTATGQVVLELAGDMGWQGRALCGHEPGKLGVIALNQLVQQGLFGSVP